MAIGNIMTGIFVFFVFIIIICITIAFIGVQDNETEEFTVDCYDKKGNVINDATCIEERYYCNKFQDLFLGYCVGDED